MSELNFQLLEENIRMLLVKNNITQQKLAEIAGMTQANVSKALKRNVLLLIRYIELHSTLKYLLIAL